METAVSRFFFFQAEDGIRDDLVTGVQTCALPIYGDFDPFEVYRVLRQVNPSPYMYFLAHPEATVVGSSPEALVKLVDGRVISRPIAGTRWRGRTDEHDRRMAAELIEDPKERAEHIMLVDLARNDVGRVVRYGSEHVDELMTLERYSHVMHMTSQVSGDLADGKTAVDVLRATFPAGTVSGAPKVRAMEIIDELEPTKRGPYAGVVGYFDFSANLDTVGDGDGVHSLLLTPQGKLDVDFRLLRVGDEAWLDCDPGFGEQLAASLNRFRIRVKCDVADRTGSWGSLAVRGPGAVDFASALDVEVPAAPHAHVAFDDAVVVRAPWPDGDGFDVVGPPSTVATAADRLTAAGVAASSSDAYEALRIEVGVPRQGYERDEKT